MFIELKARDLEALKELQSDIAMELTRSKISVDRLTLRQKEGFLSVLPVGFNQFGAQYERVLPVSSVANLYPFNFSGKTDPKGLYIGRDKYGTNILVDFDRRAEDKTTSSILILGNSGQGKSYLLKLLLTNIRESGKRIICLDPESEYEQLCAELGGCYIDFMSGEYTINPLEPKAWTDGLDDVGAAAEDDTDEADLQDDEAEAAEEHPQAEKSEHLPNMWSMYFEAKALLDCESEQYDPKEAVALLIESARLGCVIAKYRLGKMFLRGEHVPRNPPYALQWLEEAIEDGNHYAEYLLGKALLKGDDTEPDIPRGEELLKWAADKGNRCAQYTLGKTLLEGELLLQDIPQAVTLLTASAEHGFAPAQYMLGKLLYRGEYTPQDLERAVRLFERAAAQKNPYAAYLAGKMRLTEDAVKDVAKAIRNFEIAAENGNDFAEYQLGRLYLCGKEVGQDYDKAIAWLSAATGALRLLHHISRLIQTRLEDKHHGSVGMTDRKLRKIIDEKKQAHGLRQG